MEKNIWYRRIPKVDVLLESKDFKNGQGMHLASFNKKLRFSIVCDEQYAVNNVMWL